MSTVKSQSRMEWSEAAVATKLLVVWYYVKDQNPHNKVNNLASVLGEILT